MASVKTRDEYKLQTGKVYEAPLDIPGPLKHSFSQLFLSLQGCSWCYNFGWIGQTKV